MIHEPNGGNGVIAMEVGVGVVALPHDITICHALAKKEDAVYLTDQHYHYLQINSQRKVKRLQSSQSGQFREWMISFWEIVHRFWLNDLFWVRTVHFWPLGTYLDVFKFAIPITIFQKGVESFSCKSLILKFSYHRWLACGSATVCHTVCHTQWHSATVCQAFLATLSYLRP